MKTVEEIKAEYGVSNSAEMLDILQKESGMYAEIILDGLKDQDNNWISFCHRVFIYRLGKPTPEPYDDHGCFTTFELAVNKAIEEIHYQFI